MRFHFRSLTIAACLLGLCLGNALAQDSPACAPSDGQMRRVVDMAKRSVVLPKEVRRIATVGSVPVLNGYLFALGAGEHIINGLPARFSSSGRWKLHNAIAPHLAVRPVLQGQVNSEISIENLVRHAPDVVLTMDLQQVRVLEKARVPVLYLEWGSLSDIHANMRLLGCALGRMEQSEAYLRYFDDTMQRMGRILDRIPKDARPTVLYFNPQSMNTPLLIANWWIAQAGGYSATADMSRTGNAHYSHERVLLWNPDVFIVSSPQQREAVYQDERFSKIKAVRNKRVFVTPMGAHTWGQRTVEQPLTLLWAAKNFHPEYFSHIDMEEEIRSFYRRFFNYGPSDEEIRTMLDGSPG